MQKLDKTISKMLCCGTQVFAMVDDSGRRGGWADLHSYIDEYSHVTNNATVVDSVLNSAIVAGNSTVVRSTLRITRVVGTSTVNASNLDSSYVSGMAAIEGAYLQNTNAQDRARVRNSNLKGCSIMHNALVRQAHMVRVELLDDAEVAGVAMLSNTRLGGKAYLNGNRDFLQVTGLGSIGRPTTAYKTVDGDIMIRCGCFSGSISDFTIKVEETYGKERWSEKSSKERKYHIAYGGFTEEEIDRMYKGYMDFVQLVESQLTRKLI